MKIADAGRCSCGGIGHVEAIASGTAIGLRAARAGLVGEGNAPTALAVAQAADAGDATAIRILAEAGDALGRAFAMTALCVDPEVICLGGGVSGAGEAFGSRYEGPSTRERCVPWRSRGPDLAPMLRLRARCCWQSTLATPAASAPSTLLVGDDLPRQGCEGADDPLTMRVPGSVVVCGATSGLSIRSSSTFTAV